DSTNLNSTYQITLNGVKPEHMYGSVLWNINPSSVNGRQIKTHQIKVKLTSPDLSQNSLTIDSPFFNVLIRGNIEPANVFREAKYWGTYFKNRVSKEILLDSTQTVRSPVVTDV